MNIVNKILTDCANFSDVFGCKNKILQCFSRLNSSLKLATSKAFSRVKTQTTQFWFSLQCWQGSIRITFRLSNYTLKSRILLPAWFSEIVLFKENRNLPQLRSNSKSAIDLKLKISESPAQQAIQGRAIA